MGHFLSDLYFKVGTACALVFSFIEAHIAFVSILIGLAGFLVRWHYDRKEDKRRERIAEAKLAGRIPSDG